MSEHSAHDWLRPRLDALLAEAAQAGIPHDRALAALAELTASPAFIPAAQRHSVGPEDEARGGPEAAEPPEIRTDD